MLQWLSRFGFLLPPAFPARRLVCEGFQAREFTAVELGSLGYSAFLPVQPEHTWERYQDPSMILECDSRYKALLANLPQTWIASAAAEKRLLRRPEIASWNPGDSPAIRGPGAHESKMSLWSDFGRKAWHTVTPLSITVTLANRRILSAHAYRNGRTVLSCECVMQPSEDIWSIRG